MYLQVVINISFQVVLTFVLYWYLFKLLFTSFTSTRCRLLQVHVVFVLPFV